MPVMNLSQEKALKAYEQLVEILHDLWAVSSEQEDGENGDSLSEGEVLQELIQELVDRGVEEESAERAFRAIAAFRRSARNAA